MYLNSGLTFGFVLKLNISYFKLENLHLSTTAGFG